jgi:outer membrane protein
MMHTSGLRFLAVALVAATLVAPCGAQAQSFERVSTGITDTLQNAVDLLPEGVNNVRLGIGPSLSTSYEGSDHYRLDPVPVVSLRYKNLIEVDNNEVKIIAFKSVISSGSSMGGGNFRAGPLVKIDFGRGEGDDIDLRGMGNVGTSFELGAFVSYTLGNSRVRLRARQDVAGGHKGANIMLDFNHIFIRSTDFALGGVISGSFATAPYMRSFFGVNAAQAAATGYPQFNPGGTFKDVTFSLNGNYAITPQWALVASVGYERLLNGAANSPIVRMVGSPNQMSASAFIVYSF